MNQDSPRINKIKRNIGKNIWVSILIACRKASQDIAKTDIKKEDKSTLRQSQTDSYQWQNAKISRRQKRRSGSAPRVFHQIEFSTKIILVQKYQNSQF